MARRRFEMHHYRQALLRMRQGDSDRDIAAARVMGRPKAAQWRRIAEQQGWLDTTQPLPGDEAIAAALGSLDRRSGVEHGKHLELLSVVMGMKQMKGEKSTDIAPLPPPKLGRNRGHGLRVSSPEQGPEVFGGRLPPDRSPDPAIDGPPPSRVTTEKSGSWTARFSLQDDPVSRCRIAPNSITRVIVITWRHSHLSPVLDLLLEDLLAERR